MSDLPPDAPVKLPADAGMLRGFLAGRDVPCPRCGYNLRDAGGDVCAECGTVVRLGVHPVEPVMRAWIAAVVAASLGAGIGLLFLALVVGQGMPPESDLWWMMFVSWGCIPVAIALAARRRPFLRLSTPTQWMWAMVFGITVVALFIGMMTIR